MYIENLVYYIDLVDHVVYQVHLYQRVDMRFAIVHEKVVNSVIIHVPLCRSTKPTKHKNVTLIECKTMGEATDEAWRIANSHSGKDPLVCRCVSGYLESLK